MVQILLNLTYLGHDFRLVRSCWRSGQPGRPTCRNVTAAKSRGTQTGHTHNDTPSREWNCGGSNSGTTESEQGKRKSVEGWEQLDWFLSCTHSLSRTHIYAQTNQRSYIFTDIHQHWCLSQFLVTFTLSPLSLWVYTTVLGRN